MILSLWMSVWLYIDLIFVICLGQSQLLGNSQQQQQQHNQNQPTTVQSSCNYNNNNNNNNNNNLIAGGNNTHSFSPDNLRQDRTHQVHQQQQLQTQQQHQQQQQHQNGSGNQQKQQHSMTVTPSTGTSTNLGITVPSIAQNHRNLQTTHQKPVSSVAPSFSVKSQIYQTSSTKIHPVMPQTLSLLGRGHANNAPNYNIAGLNVQSSNNQQQQQQATVTTTQLVQSSCAANQEITNYNAPRHGYMPGSQQQQQQQYPNQTNIHTASPAIYQVQRDSSNLASVGLHGTVATATFASNSSNMPKYNQPMQVSSSSSDLQVQDPQNQVLNGQKTKFDPGKSQDKFEHLLLPPKHEQQQQQQQTRYDSNLTKYESQQNKYEQHGKYEQPTTVQSSKLYEQQQQNKLHDQGTGQLKHEQQHHNTKYEVGRDTQQFAKHEQQQHEGRQSTKYEIHNPAFKHDASSKYESNTQYKTEYKPEQNKFEAQASKYEQNSTVKHAVDHAAKFDIPMKASDKPYEFERSKSDGERKNFSESRMEDKTKPALPPKPSKPNPPPRLTHHEKIDASTDVISECKMTSVNLNSRFVHALSFDLKISI